MMMSYVTKECFPPVALQRSQRMELGLPESSFCRHLSPANDRGRFHFSKESPELDFPQQPRQTFEPCPCLGIGEVN